jgi:hypothetical protein
VVELVAQTISQMAKPSDRCQDPEGVGKLEAEGWVAAASLGKVCATFF